jgi:hypothetical protein
MIDMGLSIILMANGGNEKITGARNERPVDAFVMPCLSQYLLLKLL